MTRALDEVSAERRLRKHWAIACISAAVTRGRDEGWLVGEGGCSVEPIELADSDHGTTPMCRLQRALALGPIEMNVLWLLALVELDPQVASLALVLASAGQHQLNAMIVQTLASSDEGDCDSNTIATLCELGLVELECAPQLPLYRRSLRVNDRVLDLVRGKLDLDREIAPWTYRVAPQRAFDIDVPSTISKALRGDDAPFVVVTGVEGAGRQTLLREAAARAGATLLVVRASSLATDAPSLTRQLRALRRECLLHGAWPLFVEADVLADRVALLDRELFSTFDHPILATARESLAWPIARPLVSLPLAIPDEPARVELWQRALPGVSSKVIAEAARRYTIGPGMLERAATTAASMVGTDELAIDHVHLALRAQLERKLLGLATRIETSQCWADLVMPRDQLELLAELVARVKHRKQVLDTWGFQRKVGKGNGLSVLLSGPPGTGKTMVAGLVAKELGLDLYQVDLSKIVSKYIGETEKQLAQLFEAAESGHSILLFDEADSMFGKRTEVRSSNDRYANLEVNYLLQRMEAFTGITLLTTNHETSIDPAFHRRLAMHVRVPMPDEQHRADLWQSMLPEAAAVQGPFDFDRLASEFVMSGGYIKNAALRAAYLAADDGSPITFDHLLRAAHAEYEGMGKVTQRATSTL